MKKRDIPEHARVSQDGWAAHQPSFVIPAGGGNPCLHLTEGWNSGSKPTHRPAKSTIAQADGWIPAVAGMTIEGGLGSVLTGQLNPSEGRGRLLFRTVARLRPFYGAIMDALTTRQTGNSQRLMHVRGRAWRCVSRWIVAGLMALGLVGCGEEREEETKANAPPRDEWAELCAIKDCSQYPDGYITVQLDNLSYYFPLSLFGRSLAVTGLQHEKRIGKGYLRAGYSDLRSNSTSYVNSAIFFKSFPRKNYAPSNLLIDWPLTLTRPGLLRIDRNRDNPNSVLDRRPASTDGLPKIGVFRILEQSGEVRNYGGGEIRRTKIVLESEVALLNGYPVRVECHGACHISTINSAATRDNKAPHVRLEVWMRGYQARACESPNPLVECDIGIEAFEDLGEAIKMFDDMLKKLQVKPDNLASGDLQ